MFVAVSALFGEGKTEAKQKEKVHLHILGRNWAEKFLNPWLETYAAENNLTIEHAAYPFRQYFETVEIKSQAQAKDIDVVFVDIAYVASYAARGIVKPVDKYFPKDDMNSWVDGSRKGAMYNGKLYAPAWRTSSALLFYNKTLLKKAGVPFPSADIDKRWTWKQVVEGAKKVTALGDDIWGLFLDQVTHYYQLQPLPMSLGGSDGLTKDGKADVASDAWVKAFKWYYDTFHTWKVSPVGLTYAEADSFFAAGKMGFYVSGDWDIANLAKKDVDFGVAPHPYFEGGRPVTPTGSWHVGVWSYTQHEEEAAKLVWNMTVPPEGFPKVTFDSGRIPASKPVLQKYIVENPKYDNPPFSGYKIALHEMVNTAEIRMQTPAYLEVDEILTRTFSDIRNGTDPKAALEAAEDQINQALARYK
jgi:ABC-type glycerol-3-phosphate transport system substrate-binding protein